MAAVTERAAHGAAPERASSLEAGRERQAEEAQFRLGLTRGEVKDTVADFFGSAATFSALSRQLVSTGQMAPKEPISVEGVPNAGKYLLREIPFYVKDPGAFAEWSARFQSWLSQTGLTPALAERGKSGSFVKDLTGADGVPRFLYVQRFVEGSTPLAASYKTQAVVGGHLLDRFHRAGARYPELERGPTALALRKNSGDIQDELFTWVGSRFNELNADPALQRQFADLLSKSKAHRAQLQLDEAAYPVLKRTTTHGDYNPGNVIRSPKANQIIDFDDLRIDHPAADIAHALAQMMVFRFFDRSIQDRNVPTALSAEAKRVGEDFLQGYFSANRPAAEVQEIFERLKVELPLAVERGVLLGFLAHIDVKHLPTAFANAQALEKDYLGCLARMKDGVEAAGRARDLAARPTFHIPTATGVAPAGVMDGFTPGLVPLAREYYVEHLDPLHQRAPQHAPLLQQWRSTEPERGYFDWLAEHRVLSGPVDGAKYTAYLRGTEEAQQARAMLRKGRLTPLTDADVEWMRRIQESTEISRLLAVYDADYNLSVGFKEPKPDGTSVQHTSHTNGGPVRLPGFIYVQPDLKVVKLKGESGHYKPGSRGLYDVVLNEAKTGGLDPTQIKVEAFGQPELTGAQFLSQPRPAADPVNLVPKSDWLAPFDWTGYQ